MFSFLILHLATPKKQLVFYFVNHFVDYDNFDCQNDHDYIIKENTTLIKSSEYYYIDYQSFVVDNYMGFDQEGPSAELKNRLYLILVKAAN